MQDMVVLKDRPRLFLQICILLDSAYIAMIGPCEESPPKKTK